MIQVIADNHYRIVFNKKRRDLLVSPFCYTSLALSTCGTNRMRRSWSYDLFKTHSTTSRSTTSTYRNRSTSGHLHTRGGIRFRSSCHCYGFAGTTRITVFHSKVNTTSAFTVVYHVGTPILRWLHAITSIRLRQAISVRDTV